MLENRTVKEFGASLERGPRTGPAPRDGDVLAFRLGFPDFLERLRTSKATTYRRLKNTTFCQNAAPMGATF